MGEMFKDEALNVAERLYVEYWAPHVAERWKGRYGGARYGKLGTALYNVARLKEAQEVASQSHESASPTGEAYGSEGETQPAAVDADRRAAWNRILVKTMRNLAWERILAYSSIANDGAQAYPAEAISDVAQQHLNTALSAEPSQN
jgi:hypothetical protein